MRLYLHIYTAYCVQNKLLTLYYYIYKYSIIELLQRHTYVNTEQWNCTFVICFAVNLENMIIDCTPVFSSNHNYILAYLLLNTEKNNIISCFCTMNFAQNRFYYFMTHTHYHLPYFTIQCKRFQPFTHWTFLITNI